MNTDLGFRPVIIGQFSPPVLACLRSWGRKGWEPGFICLGRKGLSPPASRYLRRWYRLDPDLLHTEKGIEAIRDFLESFEASGLICIQEELAMWLDRNRGALQKFTLWLPRAEKVKKILSKSRQVEAAEKVGLRNLPTYYLDMANPNGIQEIPAHHFPLCLRPSGEGKVVPFFKVECIQTAQDGIHFVEKLESLEKPLIAQPYKNLPNLVVHGARTENDDVFGLQGFLVDRKFEGLTLTIRALDLPEEISRRCLDFVRELEIVGNFHFEFLYEPATGEYFFMEVNARLGGTTAKVFSCGYDEPVLALQAFGAKVESDGPQVLRCTASSKLALVKYLHYTMTNRITPLDYPLEPKWKRIINTLWGLASYRDDIISFKDVKGTWAFYRQSLLGKLF